MNTPLDYDNLINLDAENLAELGLKEAYIELLPKLKEFVTNPIEIKETIDSDAPAYKISAGENNYVIFDPKVPGSEENSWVLSTYAFFDIVNQQLETSEVKLYAINGGNDLGALFLTEAEARQAINELKNPTDWPYLPTLDAPWYGMGHS